MIVLIRKKSLIIYLNMTRANHKFQSSLLVINNCGISYFLIVLLLEQIITEIDTWNLKLNI